MSWLGNFGALSQWKCHMYSFLKGYFCSQTWNAETSSMGEPMYINAQFMSRQWLQSRAVVSQNQQPLCRAAWVLRLSYIIIYQCEHGHQCEWGTLVSSLILTCYVAHLINFGSYVLGLWNEDNNHYLPEMGAVGLMRQYLWGFQPQKML